MREATRPRTFAALRVVFAAIAYVALGLAVSPHPPSDFDRYAGAFGRATPLAAGLTAIGRFTGYAPLCIVVLVAGFVRRAWLGRALVSVGLLLVTTTTSDALKFAFRRARPEHWLVTHETSYSYSSGHASNSLVFFGFWAIVALRSTLPLGARVALAVGLFGLSAGIGWSRLALGAHYPTDVIGGYLLGACVLDVGLLAMPAWALGFTRQKSRLVAAWAPMRRS